MKKNALILSLLLSSQSIFAADLMNGLKVVEVEHSTNNQIASGSSGTDTCARGFKGTYAGNKVVLSVNTWGGSGKYNNRVVYTLSDSYKMSAGQTTQVDLSVDSGDTFEITLPELKDDVSFVQQTVFLITQDKKTGKSKTSQLMFNVTRPVVLIQTQDPQIASKSCRQTFPAFESVSGILSNGSTNPSQLLIKHGVQNIWDRTNGSQWGFFFSPFAWSFLGNIFSISRNYFKSFSKQTIETVEVNAGYELSPGDFVQIYEQRTRYVTPFEASVVDGCGYSKKVEGAYYLQWWGVAYHAVPVNPHSSEKIPVETIGARPMNTCSKELTPDFVMEGNSDFTFARTN